jgi:hypothetical protein
VIDALRPLGVEAVPAVWDSPDVAWEEFEMVVVRSTWDYQFKGDAFPRWVDRVARLTTLRNPAAMIRWNYDKRYLLDLARAGFAVTPTERVPRGGRTTLRSVREARGWDEVVVKPAIGAAGHHLRRFGPGEEADGEAHLAQLLREGDALVQPFLSAVRELGERSFVFLDGAFSHAIRHPMVLSTDEKAPEPLIPTMAEIEPARRIVGWVTPTPLYARVDFLPDGAGHWPLGELELIEPELFFRMAPDSPARFADVIRRHLGDRPSAGA